MSYNGWKNYETWAVNLWLTNDQGTDSYWREEAQRQWRTPDNASPHWSESERARFSLADRLESELEEAAPELGATLWADLLNAALSEVDWSEVADHFLEDCEGYKSADNVEQTP